MGDVDLALKVLQALNDENSESVAGYLKLKNVKTWIDKLISVRRIKNSRINFGPDFENDTCLGYASEFNNVATVRQLIEAGADVTVTASWSNTALHRSCWSKFDAKEKVALLLQHGPSLITARNEIDNTPLHRAALAGSEDIIEILILHGAKVNEKGSFGRTALHHSCENGHVTCIDMLMKYGADIEAKTRDFEARPLHLAADFNQVDCIKSVIENYGALINSRDKLNYTALHHAADAGHLDVVKQLASYSKCHINAKDKFDRTPADWAKAKGHQEIIDFLESLPVHCYMREASVTLSMEACNIGGGDIRVYELLTDKTLLKIATLISDDQLHLGIHLDIAHAEIKQINRSHPQFVEATLCMLLTWRERTGYKPENEQVDELEEALKEIGRKDLLCYIGRPNFVDAISTEASGTDGTSVIETSVAVSAVTSVMTSAISLNPLTTTRSSAETRPVALVDPLVADPTSDSDSDDLR